MIADDIILSAHNISKKYYMSKQSFFKRKNEEDVFWALKDVSFNLKKGQILGIIGMNGAGKSTILKILAEVIPPTSGHIEYKGSILSILDIGTGFHPDLSGYENIFFNASLLGMTKKKIFTKVDEIIAFSGIADHIHEPVKTYSSGMYLRLAISIALFSDNEIILLDEVISVGDAYFRMQAIQKIKEQASEGRACIIISHDLGSVMELCDQCLLLEKGKIIYSGNSKEVVEDYFETMYGSLHLKKTLLPEHRVCRFISTEPEKESFAMNEPVSLKIKYEVKEKADVRLVLKIRNYNSTVMTDSIAFRPDYNAQSIEHGIYETLCTIPANLFNFGKYMVDIYLSDGGTELFVFAESAAKFSVSLDTWETEKRWNKSNDVIAFRPLCDWKTTLADKN